MPQWAPDCSIQVLTARSELLDTLRQFFKARQVIEVQTPVLAPSTVTDATIESIAVPPYGYLQTSPEYLMKRLLAAGAPSLYQLGPVFRANEQGRHHNHEFTLLEWYRLGLDDGQLMLEVQELINLVLGEEPVVTFTYADIVSGGGGAPSDAADLDLHFDTQVKDLAQRYSRFFVVDFPAEQSALARLRIDNPQVAARFELVVQGVELANGYYELGDAQELNQRFAKDNQIRAERRLPTLEPDAAFLAAMNAGLPECAGVALGVDRLLMLALGVERLAEVMPFTF